MLFRNLEKSDVDWDNPASALAALMVEKARDLAKAAGLAEKEMLFDKMLKGRVDWNDPKLVAAALLVAKARGLTASTNASEVDAPVATNFEKPAQRARLGK